MELNYSWRYLIRDRVPHGFLLSTFRMGFAHRKNQLLRQYLLSFTVSVRGCRPEVFIYQAIPNFVTFTEKHQRWSSFYSNLEFRIDGTPRLLIIPFFVTLPNLNQFWRILPAAPFISDSLFINSWAQSAEVT